MAIIDNKKDNRQKERFQDTESTVDANRLPIASPRFASLWFGGFLASRVISDT
jgi:hypothetical protein